MSAEALPHIRKPYPSDLSDEHWVVLEPLVPKANSNRKRGGRPETYSKREIVNAILFVVSSGCRWSDMPHDLPPGGIAWHYFNRWSRSGRWRRITRTLRRAVREKRGRTPDPSVAIIDSQTAKGVDITEDSGYDAGKKVKGRKRHLLTDTQGLPLAVRVHSAGIQDRDGAKILLRSAAAVLGTVGKIYADGGYAGKLVEWVKKRFGIILEIVKRSDLKGFVVLPKRWIIERTNAWVSKARRLAKEYERTVRNQEAMILVRMIQLMVRWVI